MDTTTAHENGRRRMPKRNVFETADLDAGREFMNAAYGTSLRMSGTEGDQLIRHARYDFGPFCVDDVTLSMETGYDADPLESLAVVEPRTGWVEHRWEGGGERVGPGEIAVIAPPDRPFTALAHNLDFGSVVLDQSLLTEVAGLAEDQPADTLHFTGLQPASPALADHWRTTVGYVRRVLATSPEAMSEPLVLGNVARTVAAGALVTFPNTGAGESTSQDGGDATPGAVRRAVAFIEANAHLDIGLSDMATAARVTPRALQIAFARHHDTGPWGCVTRIRLDRAHFDLLAADPDDDATVAAVAARWGFAKSANFAARYHDVYGVSPESTLAI